MVIRQTDSEPSTETGAAETPAAENHPPGSRPAESGQAGRARGGSTGVPTGYAAAVATEQDYVSMLYGLLDVARARSERELATMRARGGDGGTHQARLERDISAAEAGRRLAQLSLTERGLCFGRTDDEKRNTLYIGRIGLRDDEYDLKLIDWRAPAARLRITRVRTFIFY